MRAALLALLSLSQLACPAAGDGGAAGASDGGTGTAAPGLGATLDPVGATIHFRVASGRASRVELWLYRAPLGDAERLRVELSREAVGDVFAADVDLAALAAAGIDGPVYYGYRVWGPNWTFDPAWQPGSALGFVADVDDAGNRMNPNKLLLDPYAREISHDPTGPLQLDGRIYGTGDDRRLIDSGPLAPKGIVVAALDQTDRPARPSRSLKDDIVYEVHLRGLTRADPAAGGCAGTYAGAADRADYLADLGVTAIELLPVHETWNDDNDVDPTSADGDNYWGYASLGFFAPDRRYACDQSPGGPTRELAGMIDAMHARGIKVVLDVVYNHTVEGGGGSLLSWRGLDNAGYYQLAADPARFQDNTGVGANLNVQNPRTADLVLDSLHYYADQLGVDGFRFDLAAVLGNGCERGCFDWAGDAEDGLLVRAARELPARGADGRGVDLIAEPWGIGAGTYQIGHFPAGWAEWNGRYRDLVRDDQNLLGTAAVTPGWLADRLAGSPDLFADDGRRPWHSINFLVSHDGFTLADLYRCNRKDNGQPWPLGPSSGGDDDNRSWDQGGDPARQRQAARTGLALLMLSAGVPMLTGGDETLRSQGCNNNPYNLDSPATWLDWQPDATRRGFRTFAARLLAFRRAHVALRPDRFWTGDEVSWRDADGEVLAGAAMDDPRRQVLAMELDGDALGDAARALYLVYDGDRVAARITLPPPPSGSRWFRVADTGAWMEADSNIHPAGHEYPMQGRLYDLEARSLALFLAR